MPSCGACGAVDSFDFDSSAGGQVCTQCGTLDPNSTSEAFVVLGRGDDDGQESGRAHLVDGGERYAGGPAQIKGRGIAGSGGREVYYAQKLAIYESFIRSALQYFSLSSLFDRVKTIFIQAKALGHFLWGPNARIIAAACVYIVSRERNKALPLKDLAAITEINFLTLNRAHFKVREWLNISIPAIEPAVYLERHLTHFSTLLTSSPNPPLGGSAHSMSWRPATLDWLHTLPLHDVRKLAEGLLAFADELNLSKGLGPEQASCATVLVAMEGVARSLAPNAKDIQTEMAAAFGLTAYTISERYREINSLLADYAVKLPWLAARAKLMTKKDLVANTTAIVEFREALAKRERAHPTPQERLLLGPSNDEGDEEDEDGNDNELSAALADPFPSPPSPPAGKNAKKTLPCRSSSSGARRATTSSAPSPSTSTLSSSGIDPTPKSNKAKRPREYMRQRTDPAKVARTITHAASTLLSIVSSDHSAHLPPAALLDSPLAPHDQETVRVRRQLLAGVDVIKIQPQHHRDDVLLDLDEPKRLHRLLWTRTVDEIEDEELFGPGELEGFVRTDQEVAILERTARFSEMPKSKPHDETKMRRKKKARGSRSRPTGKTEGDDGAGSQRAGSTGSDEDGFAAKRRSKVDDETRRRLAKMFAEDGEGDEDVEGVEQELEVALGIQAVDSDDETLVGAYFDEDDEDE